MAGWLKDASPTAGADHIKAAEWLARNYRTPAQIVGAFAIAAAFVVLVLILARAVGLDFGGWLYAVCVEAIAQGEAAGNGLRGLF